MALKIGIVGLPNVGKSTLFNALTKKKVDISNYPFCTIEPNVGVVSVPDERLEKLGQLSNSRKIIPAVVEFVDIAGLVKGAAEGEGLGNAFLSHIREVDAIAEVVRVFEDIDIIHVSGEKVDPVYDIEIVEYELILKDLETVSKRLASLEKETRAGKKEAKEEQEILIEAKRKLESGRFIGKQNGAFIQRSRDKRNILQELQLLTLKPVIYILNASEKQIAAHEKPKEPLLQKMASSPYVIISAKIESELTDLTIEEKKEFMVELGLAESGLTKLIRMGYETLNLITFFTTGEDETRAWTIHRGASAPCAGRAIHSDFEEKFIRAEVINWQKLLTARSLGEPRPERRETDLWSRVRELGWLRIEGKEYVVQDGDVIEFKI